MKLCGTGLLACALLLHAETGRDAWLRYAPVASSPNLPAVTVALGNSPIVATAQQEILRGVRGMTGRTMRIESAVPQEPSIIIGTLGDLQRAVPQWKLADGIPADGFWLKTISGNIVI